MHDDVEVNIHTYEHTYHAFPSRNISKIKINEDLYVLWHVMQLEMVICMDSNDSDVERYPDTDVMRRGCRIKLRQESESSHG